MFLKKRYGDILTESTDLLSLCLTHYSKTGSKYTFYGKMCLFVVLFELSFMHTVHRVIPTFY